MPLRDFFRSAVAREDFSWSSFYSMWPAFMVEDLNHHLPEGYAGGPRVYTAGSSDSDSTQFVFNPDLAFEWPDGAWDPGAPTWSGQSPRPDQDQYSVRIRNLGRQRFVAAVELVSPGHHRNPAARTTFVARCAVALREGLSVTIVDTVAGAAANLLNELLRFVGQPEATGLPSSPTYAATCRWLHNHAKGRLETWAHPLEIGRPMPTLPVWLAYDIAIPLDLEATYEETCKLLRIP